MHKPTHTTRTKRRGLTLLELLLALSGTAVIGTAVTMLITGVAYGTQTDKDLRELVTRQMALRARLEAELRESRLILDAGSDYVILWSADTNGDDLPNKSELQVIEYDAPLDRVMRYAPADGITDVAYSTSDDFRTLTDAYKGDATFPGERWAENITSVELTLDNIDPQSARLVSFRVGMNGGEVPDTVIGAASLRNEVSE